MQSLGFKLANAETTVTFIAIYFSLTHILSIKLHVTTYHN